MSYMNKGRSFEVIEVQKNDPGHQKKVRMSLWGTQTFAFRWGPEAESSSKEKRYLSPAGGAMSMRTCTRALRYRWGSSIDDVDAYVHFWGTLPL